MSVWKRTKNDAELEGVNLLELTPCRTADWEEVDGLVVLLRPAPASAGVGGRLDRFLHRLSPKRIRLDELGTFAWLRMGGERTVGEVAQLMREQFGEKVEPTEERLGHLVVMLRREGFLAYPGWDAGRG